jgi:type IV pilus assembly protein PilX
MKHNTLSYRTQQRGASLIVVMVMLLLGTIVVLGSSRVGWFNEILVGSESDYQRAFAAAEALIRDAERDIKGVQADNITPCRAGANFIGCRNFGTGQPFFPEEDTDLDLLQTRVTGAGSVNRCLQGICLPATVDGLSETTWNTPAALAAMTGGAGLNAIAATYGLYTQAAPAAAGNPLLSAAPARGWYWIEVFRYTDAGGIMTAAGNVPIPDKKHPFVYRITAYVQGIKGGTRVWLRSVFVPYPQNQNT